MPDHVMNYIESEAPAGLTLVEWRRARAAASPRRRRSLRSLLAVPRRGPGIALANSRCAASPVGGCATPRTRRIIQENTPHAPANDEAADGRRRHRRHGSRAPGHRLHRRRRAPCSGATPTRTSRAISRPARTATPRAPTRLPATISTSTSTERDESLTTATSATCASRWSRTPATPSSSGWRGPATFPTTCSGTSYTSVTDVDYSPFQQATGEHGGDHRPALPANQGFWAASATGRARRRSPGISRTVTGRSSS